jgi:hypothetical protein
VKQASKILSLLLALSLLFTLTPMAAFAAEGDVYTVTLKTFLDDAPYTANGGHYSLRNEDETGAHPVTAVSDGSAREASVTDGLWKLYEDSEDTGVSIVIDGGNEEVTLNYYSVSLSVTPKGTAKVKSSVNVIGASQRMITEKLDNLVFREDVNLEFLVGGSGALSYTYEWTYNGEPVSAPDVENTFPLIVAEKAVITCTVTGTGEGAESGDKMAEVKTTGDGEPYGATANATNAMTIAGVSYDDLSQPASGTDWSWDGDRTLTLKGGNTWKGISFDVPAGTVINVVVENTDGDFAIVDGDFSIRGGSLLVSGDNSNLEIIGSMTGNLSTSGNISVGITGALTGNLSVNGASMASVYDGVNGSIDVNTSGTVVVYGNVTGDVIARADSVKTEATVFEGNVGGNLTVTAVRSVSVKDVGGDLTVSNGSYASADSVGGDLTVSNGSYASAGSVGGKIETNGGKLIVDSNQSYGISEVTSGDGMSVSNPGQLIIQVDELSNMGLDVYAFAHVSFANHNSLTQYGDQQVDVDYEHTHVYFSGDDGSLTVSEAALRAGIQPFVAGTYRAKITFLMQTRGVSDAPVYYVDFKLTAGSTPQPDPQPQPESRPSYSRGSDTYIEPVADDWLDPDEARPLSASSKRQKLDYARTNRTNRYGVRGKSWAELKGLKFYHDSIANNAVQVRTYFDNPSLFTKDVRVSAYVAGAEVTRVRGKFEKWFANEIRVIHFDNPDKWESAIRVAAKLDLAGMNTAKLALYAYSTKTNSYRRIATPEYRIDANGYLHFKTELAGEIIISEGELVKK